MRKSKCLLALALMVVMSTLGAFAATSVNSDYYRVNTGARSGTFNRTAAPVTTYLLLNGTDTTGAATNIVSGEAIIEFVPAAATGETSYIKIIGKDNRAVIGDNTTQTFRVNLVDGNGYDANFGDITNVGTPDSNFEAATKVYVDTADALLLPLAGGTITGTVKTTGTLSIESTLKAGGSLGSTETITVTSEAPVTFVFKNGIFVGH